MLGSDWPIAIWRRKYFVGTRGFHVFVLVFVDYMILLVRLHPDVEPGNFRYIVLASKQLHEAGNLANRHRGRVVSLQDHVFLEVPWP